MKRDNSLLGLILLALLGSVLISVGLVGLVGLAGTSHRNSAIVSNDDPVDIGAFPTNATDIEQLGNSYALFALNVDGTRDRFLINEVHHAGSVSVTYIGPVHP